MVATTLPAVVRVVDLPTGTTVTGAELFEVVQTSAGVGQSVQLSLNQLNALVNIPAGGATGTILNKSSGSNYSTQFSAINTFVNVGTSLATTGSATSIVAFVANQGITSTQIANNAVGTNQVASSLGIASSLSIGTLLTVGGTATITGTTILNGGLQVTGTTLLTGITGVVGTSQFTGAFNVVGASQFTGAFNVVGTSILTSNLFAVVGTSAFTGGTFSVMATTNITGNLNIVGTSLLTGTLTVLGTSTFTGGFNFNILGTTTITGSFNQVGTSQFTGALNVVGTTIFTSGLFAVIGTAAFTGGTFSILATTNITGNLNVVGTATFTGAHNVIGTTIITGSFALGNLTTGFLSSNSTGVVTATTIVALATATSTSMGADVTLNNTATFFDGPSVAQGTAGTWFVTGTVTYTDATAAQVYLKLWDGSTVIASCDNTIIAGFIGMAALSGFITSPTGNLRISCRDISNVGGKILFNQTGLSKDSTLSAIRIG